MSSLVFFRCKHITLFILNSEKHLILSFVFCDKYIESSKSQDNVQTKQILAYVLLNSLKLLHPFMPFTTEEIYQNLPFEKEKTLMIEKWPKL